MKIMTILWLYPLMNLILMMIARWIIDRPVKKWEGKYKRYSRDFMSRVLVYQINTKWKAQPHGHSNDFIPKILAYPFIIALKYAMNIYESVRTMGSRDKRFGLKVGLLCIILLIFLFIPLFILGFVVKTNKANKYGIFSK